MCKRTIAMIEIFNAKEVSPIVILTFYLTAAAGYLGYDDTEESFTMLETYTEMATGDIFPLKIAKEDSFFIFVDEIQNEMLRKLPFGMPELPRDEQSFKQIMIDAGKRIVFILGLPLSGKKAKVILEVRFMVCDVCKVEMSDSTTEMEVSVKERRVKAVKLIDLSKINYYNKNWKMIYIYRPFILNGEKKCIQLKSIYQ